MSNIDNELFELCKEVYEKTEWEFDRVETQKDGSMLFFYTSDYLLEKLKRKAIRVVKVLNTTDTWFVEDVLTPFDSNQVSDTPLKALLKLILALAKAGELK